MVVSADPKAFFAMQSNLPTLLQPIIKTFLPLLMAPARLLFKKFLIMGKPDLFFCLFRPFLNSMTNIAQILTR